MIISYLSLDIISSKRVFSELFFLFSSLFFSVLRLLKVVLKSGKRDIKLLK